MSTRADLLEASKPHQFGDDIKEPGEPFTDSTLVTIRALLAEADPVPEPKPFGESLPFGKRRSKIALGDAAQNDGVAEDAGPGEAHSTSAVCGASPLLMDQQRGAHVSNPPLGNDDTEVVRRSWRTIEVVEGNTSRNLRRFLISPRMLSVAFLCGVVVWQPWFIPMLVLTAVSTLLLIGALIGQDRMARFLVFVLKRFVWANPSFGRLLQRILPQRWHPVLYRPITEQVAWDGPIDSSFEERLARIRT